MKNLYLLFVILFFVYSCNDSNSIETIQEQIEFDWIVPSSSITGSYNLFPLATNPTMSLASNINFINDNSLVALVSINNEIRAYPYQYIGSFESVNDVINGKKYAMTYCPITHSGLCWDTSFKNNDFIIRASGYLYMDNQVLIDEKSNTYWSQMLVKSIKGKYAGEKNNTFNFIELPWKTIKENFPNALVFTNTSIQNKNNQKLKKEEIQTGDLVYGIVDMNFDINNKVMIYTYENFDKKTSIKNIRFSGKEILVIGNKDLHFISSYINNSNASFKVVQNQFPIIMEDDENNKWNIFGVAVSGPRKGDQLQSPTAFVALWWAWQNFYSNFVFNE